MGSSGNHASFGQSRMTDASGAIGLRLPINNGTSYGAGADEWKHDAACIGLPTELFEYQQMQDFKKRPEFKRLRQMNKDCHAFAATVCGGCPVRQKCLDTATLTDLYWTVRGGEAPGAMKDSGRSVPREWTVIDETGKKVNPLRLESQCKRGHSNEWRIDKNTGRRYCGTCKNMNAVAYRARKKNGTVVSS